MKLLIMLVAIYALIINQSLKQKETKNAPSKVKTANKNADIRSGNNIYFNAVFKPNVTEMPIQRRNVNNIRRDFSPALYKEHPFRGVSDFSGSIQQEFFYPLNHSYMPVTKKEGSR